MYQKIKIIGTPYSEIKAEKVNNLRERRVTKSQRERKFRSPTRTFDRDSCGLTCKCNVRRAKDTPILH